MILASLSQILAVVDAFVGFGLGLFVGWWRWRHRPPDRQYKVDLTIHRPEKPKE